MVFFCTARNQFEWVDVNSEKGGRLVDVVSSSGPTIARDVLAEHFGSHFHWRAQMAVPRAAAGAARVYLQLSNRQQSQEITRLQLSLFCASSPTLPFVVAGKIMDVSRAIYQPLDLDFAAVAEDLKALNVSSQAFTRLRHRYDNIQDTVFTRHDASTDTKDLADFLHRQRLVAIRKAVTPLSLYLDESTDATTKAVLLLSCSYIDDQYSFRSEFLEVLMFPSQVWALVFHLCAHL